MTIEQLLADLQRFPGRALVVFEDARTFAPVTAASASRVHLVAGGVELHDAHNCAGCARQRALVSAVSLLGAGAGGVR
jgi:hypothetical protein